jgi:hypothetical protein
MQAEYPVSNIYYENMLNYEKRPYKIGLGFFRPPWPISMRGADLDAFVLIYRIPDPIYS